MKTNITNNYSRFVQSNCNRQIKTSHLKQLIRSMEEYGFLEAYPIHVSVRKEDDKLLIKDGQHRFESARSLKLPIRYIVCEDNNISIAKINNTQKPWDCVDYLSSYCSQGKVEYQKVKAYCDHTGIGMSMAIALLHNQTSQGSDCVAAFKRGDYKITTLHSASIVGDLIVSLRAIFPRATNKYFVAAIAKCCAVKEFSPKQFIDRVSQNSGMLKAQATIEDYILLFDKIYNYKSRNPIPLEFYCRKVMDDKNLAKQT